MSLGSQCYASLQDTRILTYSFFPQSSSNIDISWQFDSAVSGYKCYGIHHERYYPLELPLLNALFVMNWLYAPHAPIQIISSCKANVILSALMDT